MKCWQEDSSGETEEDLGEILVLLPLCPLKASNDRTSHGTASFKVAYIKEMISTKSQPAAKRF